jgi:DNA-binding CsgD family transcriptional regulator
MGAIPLKPQHAVPVDSGFRARASMPPGATAPMFEVDGNHRIVSWSDAIERFLRIPPHQAFAAPCYQILNGCGMEGDRLCGPGCRIPSLANGGAAPADFPRRLQVGARREREAWVSIMLTPAPHEGLWSVLHVLHHADDTPAADKPRAAAAPAASSLTAREQKILQLLAEGLEPAAIAERLHISCVTVRNHIQNIFGKLKVHSRLQAVAHAYRHGLISPPAAAWPGRDVDG